MSFLQDNIDFIPASEENTDLHTSTNISIVEPLPRIVCMIFTRPAVHETKAQTVKDTWAKRCDKAIFFTTMEAEANNSLGAIPLAVEEGRQNLWLKARLAFNYTFYNHLEDGDWFYKADDDTYAMLENLRRFVQPYSADELHAFGYEFKMPTPDEKFKYTYFSGGPGYVMSKAAFTKFIKDGIEGNDYSSICPKNNRSNEDIYVGKCFKIDL